MSSGDLLGAIAEASSQYPKPEGRKFEYGTAGVSQQHHNAFFDTTYSSIRAHAM